MINTFYLFSATCLIIGFANATNPTYFYGAPLLGAGLLMYVFARLVRRLQK